MKILTLTCRHGIHVFLNTRKLDTYILTGAPFWYSPVSTTRMADASILTYIVLPHNYLNARATYNIVNSVLIIFPNVCYIKIMNTQ